MKNLILLVILFCIGNFAIAADPQLLKEGKALYLQHCNSCHGDAGGMDMSKRVAPPIFAVRRHYIGSYPDEMSFINAVADWVETRDIQTSLMFGAVRRFNIMPELIIERDKVEKIAAYIYAGDIVTPAAYEQHYRQRHVVPGN